MSPAHADPRSGVQISERIDETIRGRLEVAGVVPSDTATAMFANTVLDKFLFDELISIPDDVLHTIPMLERLRDSCFDRVAAARVDLLLDVLRRAERRAVTRPTVSEITANALITM